MSQKLPCEVSQLLDHGERVYSLLLKPRSPAPHFRPGQFLHLALDEYRPGDFWPDSRSFSIASAPSERHELRITFAVKGKFTSRMEAELQPGKEVWVKMPFGDFTIQADRDVCLLAGGTGITAFTAFLAELPADYPNRVHLFYGARRPDLLIYRPLVDASVKRCPGLCVHYLAEQGVDGTDCLPGRIDPEAIWKWVPEPEAMTYYLAGPPQMLEAVAPALRLRGVDPERVIIDAWE